MERGRTRTRLIEAAMGLIQRGGYHATSWRGVVNNAGLPLGLVYHHFPEGKEELAVAAIERAGEIVASSIDRCFERHENAPDAVRAWFRAAAKQLERSGYTAGCPLATLALETVPASERLTRAVREAFDRSHRRLAAGLEQHAIPPARARELAGIIYAGMEGALLLARVRQSPKPLQATAEHLAATVAEEVATRRRAKAGAG